MDKMPALENTDGASVESVLAAVAHCAASWEPGARLVGNVRAGDILRAVTSILAQVDALTKERDEYYKDAEHFARLACDDLGKNPPMFWKDRVIELEKERDKWKEMAHYISDDGEWILWRDYADREHNEAKAARARAIAAEQRVASLTETVGKLVKALETIKASAAGIMPLHSNDDALKAIVFGIDDAAWTRLLAILLTARAALEKHNGR